MERYACRKRFFAIACLAMNSVSALKVIIAASAHEIRAFRRKSTHNFFEKLGLTPGKWISGDFT